MTRRRETRRRHRQERRERDPAFAPRQDPEKKEAAAKGGISVLGVAGGLAGLLPFVGVAVGILIDPGTGDRSWAVPFAIAGLGFLPVTVASWINTPRRRSVQRVTVYACLGLAAGGTLLTGSLIIATLLAVPTTLIAIAAGFVFQPSRSE